MKNIFKKLISVVLLLVLLLSPGVDALSVFANEITEQPTTEQQTTSEENQLNETKKSTQEDPVVQEEEAPVVGISPQAYPGSVNPAELELTARFLTGDNDYDLDFGVSTVSSPVFQFQIDFKSIIYAVDAAYKPGDLILVVPDFFTLISNTSNSNQFEYLDRVVDPVSGRQAARYRNIVDIGPGETGSIVFETQFDHNKQEFFVVENIEGVNRAFFRTTDWFAHISGTVSYGDNTQEDVSADTTDNLMSAQYEQLKKDVIVNKSSNQTSDIPVSLKGSENDYFWADYHLDYRYNSTQLWELSNYNSAELVDYLPLGAELVSVRSHTGDTLYEMGADNSSSIVSYNPATNVVKVPVEMAQQNLSRRVTLQVRFPKTTFQDTDTVVNNIDITGYYHGESIADTAILDSSNVAIKLSEYEFLYIGDIYSMRKTYGTSSSNKQLFVNSLISDDLNSRPYNLHVTKKISTVPVDVVVGDNIRAWESNNTTPAYDMLSTTESYVKSFVIRGVPAGISSGTTELYVLKEGQAGNLSDYTLYSTYDSSITQFLTFSKDEKIVSYFIVIKVLQVL